MTEDRSPAFMKESFVCPFCEAFSAFTWRVLLYSGGGQSGLRVARCTACKYESVWFDSDGQMIYPGGLGGPPPVDDMPETVASIYGEARAIMQISPRSACALIRLALEGLLDELYPEAENLNLAIGAAAADGLPQPLINAMDVLRFNGNASIHEISREDTPENAHALASILNMVVLRLITEPRQIREMHDALPEGVRQQIERRDAATE